MKYDPKDANNCLPAGEYDATLTAVINTDKEGGPLRSSKTQEPMEKIVYTVYSEKGERVLYDYIVESAAAWKYKAIAKALGATAEYDNKTFEPANFTGHNLRLELKIEEYEGQDQNKIKKVLPKNGGPSTTKSVSVTRPQTKFSNGKVVDMDESQIPF